MTTFIIGIFVGIGIGVFLEQLRLRRWARYYPGALRAEIDGQIERWHPLFAYGRRFAANNCADNETIH